MMCYIWNVCIRGKRRSMVNGVSVRDRLYTVQICPVDFIICCRGQDQARLTRWVYGQSYLLSCYWRKIIIDCLYLWNQLIRLAIDSECLYIIRRRLHWCRSHSADKKNNAHTEAKKLDENNEMKKLFFHTLRKTMNNSFSYWFLLEKANRNHIYKALF